MICLASVRRVAAGGVLAAGLGLGGLAVLVVGIGWVWAALLVVAGGAVLGGATVLTCRRLVGGLIGLGVASSCWDAVRIGGTGLFDVLCLIGIAAVAADLTLRRGSTVRWPARPLMVSFAGFALAALLVAVFPPDSFFLSSRFELPRSNLGAAIDPSAGGSISDAGALGRIAIGLLLVPIVLGRFAATWDGLATVGRAFVAGAAVSSAVALTDRLGITEIGEMLIGYVNAEDRSVGLTSQPNHLALTAAIALPFAWLLVRRWPARALLIVLLLAGIYVSGSRAGLIGAAVSLLACAGWRYRARFLLASVPTGVAALLALSALLSVTRFGSDSAAGSDVERSLTRGQGVADFLESPLYGVGMHVSQEAHIVYLQVLASSGLIGMVSFAILIGAALAAAHRGRDRAVMVAAGFALLAYLVVAVASNALWTRYMFVPLVVLFVASRMPGAADSESSQPRAEIDRMVSVVETPGVRGR